MNELDFGITVEPTIINIITNEAPKIKEAIIEANQCDTTVTEDYKYDYAQ